MPWFPYNTQYLAFGTKSGSLAGISPEVVIEKMKIEMQDYI